MHDGGVNVAAPFDGLYPEIRAGGFTRFDGTVQFYSRIHALLRPDMRVLDFGAGRGGQMDTDNAFVRDLLVLKGKVAHLAGVDVDNAVLGNPWLDDARTFDGGALPYDGGEFDLIYSDWVLEHVPDAAAFAREVDRVLKPGGWFCARTPNKFSYLTLASSLIPNRLHARTLEKVQAGNREARDVFPTHYRLNTVGALKRHFPPARWQHCSYTWSAEPSYHFGSPVIVRAMAAAQYVKRPLGGENLFVFVQKRA